MFLYGFEQGGFFVMSVFSCLCRVIKEYSILMILGGIVALVWANMDYVAYHHMADMTLWENQWIGTLKEGYRSFNMHFLVNDLLMAFFFALAGKEVWESIVQKNGSLRGRKAAIPLFATFGGIFAPVSLYVLGIVVVDQFESLANGWAIPAATDIAFSYLFARLIFGSGHPAVGFLLLLAIADDAIGLIIIAVFYPTGELQLQWLILSVCAALFAFLSFSWFPRYLDRTGKTTGCFQLVSDKLSYVPYLLLAFVSWYGFYRSGIHSALGFLPVIMAMPHGDLYRQSGCCESVGNDKHDDVLNKFEHAIKIPVEVILCLFAFVNAGVLLSNVGVVSWIILLSLLIGKPVGIYLFSVLGLKLMQADLPEGMKKADLLVIGFLAAIGFSVAMFIATVSFDAGKILDGAKMGALLSFGAAAPAFLMARLVGVQRKGE